MSKSLEFLFLDFPVQKKKPAKPIIILVSTPATNKALTHFIKLIAWMIALQLMRSAVYADRSRIALIIWKTCL